jgi:hypothetical protein
MVIMREGGRREDGDLPFPKLKSLYYYWSLIILIYLTEYLSNNKQGKIGIAHELHFLVLCYMPYYRCISLSSGCLAVAAPVAGISLVLSTSASKFNKLSSRSKFTCRATSVVVVLQNDIL